MLRHLLLACCLAFITPTLATAKLLTLASPDQQIVVTVSDEQDTPNYSVKFQGKPIINPSKLGLVFQQQGDFADGFKLSQVKRQSSSSQWQQPWGERRLIDDNHNELEATFSHPEKGSFTVRVRSFDDGIGFRYEVPKQKGLGAINITDELTEFNVAQSDKSTAWWIPSRGWSRYEYTYNTTPLHDVDRAHTPFTFKNGDGVHLSIHEAALVDYAAMSIDQRRPGTLKADLTPWSDGIKVKTQAGFVTPWRTIQISKDAVGLLNSNIILNLNEPNKLGDVSWVKPGKYVGIWWGMHIGTNTWGSGKKHGATTANTKYFMDFAAKYGFAGVLVEGWNEGWDGEWFINGDLFSFTKSYLDFDIEELARYGKSKGVQLIGHHETSGSVTNYRRQMTAAFDLYQKNNVSQVKTGYVADGGNIKRIDATGVVRKEWHDGQFMAAEYLHSVTEAAKRKISINTHEPIKDTGLRRTYPNWITREGARGQEFNAWGSPPNPPEHTALLPFTRMLAGPMDFTPGIFDLAWNGLDAENRVQTTLAKQLALYIVLYSPIQMAADLPKNYEAKPQAFQFIRDVVTDWEQSIALDGEVGDFVVMARQARDSSDWFVGALSDENARVVSVPLHFLSANKKYRAEIYRDGDSAHWRTNPYNLVVEAKTVSRSDTLNFKLGASGGVAIRLVELK